MSLRTSPLSQLYRNLPYPSNPRFRLANALSANDSPVVPLFLQRSTACSRKTSTSSSTASAMDGAWTTMKSSASAGSSVHWLHDVDRAVLPTHRCSCMSVSSCSIGSFLSSAARVLSPNTHAHTLPIALHQAQEGSARGPPSLKRGTKRNRH